MKNSRRMKRMARSKRNKVGGLSLTSLMDVFTILVLYLLVNQSSGTVMDPPKNVKLPDSAVTTKPRESLMVSVSAENIVVQDLVVATVQEVLDAKGDVIEPIRDRMIQIRESALGTGDQASEENKEVTVMGHKTVPFKVLKRVMASCTAAGYSKISLAVNLK